MEKPRLIPQHDLFDHLGGRDAGKVAAARCHGEREGEPNDVVCRVADNCLVEVANFNFNATIGAGHRTEVPDVAIAANPHRRPLRNRAFTGVGKPLVELDRVAADIGVDAARHLATALLLEDASAILEGDGLRFSVFVGTQIWMHPLCDRLPTS
jgi:hypothetical protein